MLLSGKTETWVWDLVTCELEKNCIWKVITQRETSLQKLSLPMLSREGLEPTCLQVVVCGQTLVVNTCQPGTSPRLLSLACQPSAWTCELNSSAALWKRGWLDLEISEHAPGPAGFINASCCGYSFGSAQLGSLSPAILRDAP